MATSTGMRITGVDGVVARLRGIGKRSEDVSGAWPKVGSYISGSVRRQFSTQGAYFGTPWKPLKPEYRLWKLRHGFPATILVQSGKMRSSFTRRPMSVEVYTGNTARFGSSDEKAVWHHYGTHRNGKRVNPPRKILVATADLKRGVKDILADHIMGRA